MLVLLILSYLEVYTDISAIKESIDCISMITLIVRITCSQCLESYLNTKGPTSVLGDFNCPDMDWENWSVPSNAISLQLYNFAVSNGFIYRL